MAAPKYMMFTALALAAGNLAFVAAQTGSDDAPTFASFIAKHRRTYSHGSAEYESRQALFEKRVAVVKHHNSQANQLWTAVVNHLADRTEEELAALRGWKGHALSDRSAGHAASRKSRGSRSGLFLGQGESAVVEAIPSNHTWEHLNAIKSHVDQGGCGSCWAIATTTMMNAAAEIAGTKKSFAAQDLVDCVPNPHHCGGSGGCQGATVELAMNWISENGFRELDASPYFGEDRQCYARSQVSNFLMRNTNFVPSGYDLQSMIAIGQHEVKQGSAGASIGLKSWTRLPENEYLPLLSHLVQHGPVAVSVSASGWNEYGDGIFNSCSVDAVVDHAVVLFGYGNDATAGQKFWEIKNSWGPFWGRSGNMRLLREDTVKCGVDRQPEVGTGCDGGPKEVKVCGMCGILYDSVSVHM